MKKKLILGLKIIFTIFIFYLLYSFMDVEKTAQQLMKLNLLKSFIICLVWITTLFITTFRWYLLIRPIDKQISYFYLFRSYLIGFFFNTFLPTTIGGDVYRIIRINKMIDSKSQSTAIVFIERLVGFLAIAMLAVVSMLLLGKGVLYEKLRWLAFGSLIVLTISVFTFFNDRFLLLVSKLLKKGSFFKLGERIKKFYEKIHHFKNHKSYLFYTFLISIIYQLVVVLTFYTTARFLMIEISYTHLILFVCMISIITLLPISIGGLGLREGGFALLFELAGFSREGGFAVALLVTFFTTLVHTSGGFFYIFENK